MEEEAFPLGFRNLVSFELGDEERAFKAERKTRTEALMKPGVHRLLASYVWLKRMVIFFFLLKQKS